MAYGLESLQLTNSLRSKIHTFQLKGLRRICKITTTFVNRDHANDYVFAKASELAGRTIEPITQFLDNRAIRLWLRLVRAEESDQMKMVALMADGISAYRPGHRRVGRPRKNWITETAKRTWNEAQRVAEVPEEQTTTYEEKNDEMRSSLKTIALNRLI